MLFHTVWGYLVKVHTKTEFCHFCNLCVCKHQFSLLQHPKGLNPLLYSLCMQENCSAGNVLPLLRDSLCRQLQFCKCVIGKASLQILPHLHCIYSYSCSSRHIKLAVSWLPKSTFYFLSMSTHEKTEIRLPTVASLDNVVNKGSRLSMCTVLFILTTELSMYFTV